MICDKLRAIFFSLLFDVFMVLKVFIPYNNVELSYTVCVDVLIIGQRILAEL